MFNIIPQPVSILVNQEKDGFTLKDKTVITLFDFAKDFALFVKKVFNKNVQLEEKINKENSIVLTVDGSIEQDEGYTLCCRGGRVFINARTETGLFW